MRMPCDRLSIRFATCLSGLSLLAAALPVFAAHQADAEMPATLSDCNTSSFETMLHPATAMGARALWLDRRLLLWPGMPQNGRYRLYYAADGDIVAHPGAKLRGADGAIDLQSYHAELPPAIARRFGYAGAGAILSLPPADDEKLGELQRQQLVIALEDEQGRLLQATAIQAAGALDDLYAAAAKLDDLGVSVDVGTRPATRFKVWAPTARRVAVCSYQAGKSKASAVTPLHFDQASGAWAATLAKDLSGGYYLYMVDVFVPSKGLVRNRVTDPYSVSLTTDSRRSYIANLDDARLKPTGWDNDAAARTLEAHTDMSVYELHIRDFSINDPTVSPAHRGKYAAFTDSRSNGMRHLAALAAAGLTDVHLLPAFDFASVPETGCLTPKVAGAPADNAQQATVSAVADKDCYNWGYDPYHYSAPEGSYSTDAADGARRVLEFRQMVAALHRTGLRVGMDVVYNHTFAAGQKARVVLDRIVPGYYHRLDKDGRPEQSTCCDNTATENLMMGKLMLDSVTLWARQYHIDSFRFDLMAHQPRALMEQLQRRLQIETGRDIPLIGEGWNFGEVANGARFVQASQLLLNGSDIGTFSDRARDAVRGGKGQGSLGIVQDQGYINGLVYDPNAWAARSRPRQDLLRSADMVRVGLAGSLRHYTLQTYDGSAKELQDIPYGDQPAGYVSQPDEVVNYVENHDNQTLFDINAYKLPTDTSKEDRTRVQILGAAVVAFSQGIAYYHAGIDILRSKSMDGNSFNSGDWFNRLDWSYQDNYFGTGLPPQRDNGSYYPILKDLLPDGHIKPGPQEIALARDMFRDLLKIRASSTLFRLRSAADVQERLRFYNTGPDQEATVLAARIAGEGYAGAGFKNLLYFINVDKQAHRLTIPEEQGQHWVLHPVHMDAHAADPRPAAQAGYDAASGSFTLPPRTAVVFVEP